MPAGYPFGTPITEVVAGLMQLPANLFVLNVGALIFLSPPQAESSLIVPESSIVRE